MFRSDGTQPHLVNIQFLRKTAVQNVCIYTNFRVDESYTPSKISIRAGSHFHDLEEITSVTLNEPEGWTVIPMSTDQNKPCCAFMIQLAVLTNHQNGRDTHLRRIRVHAPPTDMTLDGLPPFTSKDFQMWSSIR
jgi:anaphase-promoting complex subunit 10